MSKCESEKCANGCRSGRCGDDGAGGGSEVCPPPGWEPYAALDATRDSMAALDAARDSMAALDAARRSVSGIDVLRRLAREADGEDRGATPDFPAGGPVYPEAGLAFSRTFSGGPPPKLVERTAEIKDAKGNIVFRQEGVLFPEEYSQTAVNVVSGKYLYGDVDNGSGNPREGKREYSMAMLVDRVVGPIAKWGREDGYFKSAEDADVFADDLRAILLGQYAAFNSPVWFNLGVWHSYGVESDIDAWRWDPAVGDVVPLKPGEAYKYPGLSACYIQGVDDSLAAIMDLAKAEAMLFKNGSGTGADLSTLRSTREKLTGGGRPSGPVSFFRVYDAVASVIKSGGRSRRAARMQTLRVDHPDVAEFAECKVKEDRKARALVAAGWSAGMTGSDDEAYSSVAFQNTNISLRATDEFMRKASGDDPDPYYWTKAVVDGRPVEKLDAREVLDLIARGTWECGDPGMQYHDTINRWNTAADTCELKSSNPCGEYNYVNDSSCNLASLRLTRFLRDDGTFDVARFEAAVRVVLTAQEIIVDHASYPTRKIARNSHDHRPLGLGYADLGALLMSLGLPYDSAAGRSYAGAIAAVMQGAAARTSAEMARVRGPYPAFAANRGSMLRVMRMHADGARDGLAAATALGSPALLIWERAADLWSEESLAFGAAHGYMNAQLSVQAPTGTISFMMGCRTTGIEPEIGLVKYKSLSGGGLMKLVNDGVGPALSRLGYSDREVAAIVAHIEATDSIEGAPHLKTAHLPVFDCAFAAGDGGRTISWQGHVEMMAAIQPFISGAQSKTINIPSSFDVNAIRRIYIEAWRLGLKAVAIYRDGSKGVQPLTTKKADDKPAASAEPFTEEERKRRFSALDVVMARAFTEAGEHFPAGEVYDTEALERVAASIVARGAKASADPRELATAFVRRPDGGAATVQLPREAVEEKPAVDLAVEFFKAKADAVARPRPAPRRERLPDTRRAVNHKFNVGGHEGYLNVGLFDDGRPGELFITMAKEGSTVGGLMDVVGTLTSMCLQYGVPLEVLVEKLSHVRFEPQGFTKNPDVPIAKSLVDYIFRWLGAEFIPGWREEHCPSREVDAGKPAAAGVVDRPTAPSRKSPQGDAPACSECGAITVRAGSCYTCVQCGSSSGCG